MTEGDTNIVSDGVIEMRSLPERNIRYYRSSIGAVQDATPSSPLI